MWQFNTPLHERLREAMPVHAGGSWGVSPELIEHVYVSALLLSDDAYIQRYLLNG